MTPKRMVFQSSRIDLRSSPVIGRVAHNRPINRSAAKDRQSGTNTNQARAQTDSGRFSHASISIASAFTVGQFDQKRTVIPARIR
jgi:hypothetical protein